METIIKDYYKNNPKGIKEYSVFLIEQRKDLDSSLKEAVYEVSPNVNGVVYTIIGENKADGELPTNSFLFREKLFLWSEEGEAANDSIMRSLYQKKLVDSSWYKYHLGLIPEDSVRRPGVWLGEFLFSTYVFCNCRPSKIMRRIRTVRYIAPDNPVLKVNCKQLKPERKIVEY